MGTASEVRTHVRDEHAAIVRLMDEVRAALREATDEPPFWAPTIELCETLERLLDYEDAELLPLLEHADAWGEVRVESLDDEHRAQRAMIAALLEDLGAGSRSIPELCDEIQWFVGALERDLAQERTLILAGDPLNDQCVVADQSDG
jgi:hypothetical protein